VWQLQSSAFFLARLVEVVAVVADFVAAAKLCIYLARLAEKSVVVYSPTPNQPQARFRPSCKQVIVAAVVAFVVAVVVVVVS